MDKQKQIYREEAYELLADLEEALIELEQNPDEKDLVDRVFRAMHTIKGSGAMFGFDDIAGFTHTIETVYDMIREGRIKVTENLISLTLSACDQIKCMLEASKGTAEVDDSITNELLDAFKRLIPGEEEDIDDDKTPLPDPAESSENNEYEITYRIRFVPHKNLFDNGSNPVPLLNEIRNLGNTHIICHMDNLPDLMDIDAESCYTSWDIILTTRDPLNAIKDIFIFVEDLSDINITKIDDNTSLDDGDYKRIGDILFERGDITRSDLELILNRQKRIGELLVESGKVERSEVKSALVEQMHVRNLRKQRVVGETTSSIRVASNKLDSLVNLVGELVTVQARLSQISDTKNDMDLSLVSEEVERLTAELRDNAMGIRMLPIGTTFAKFKRTVRDLAAELGKEVDIITEGEETELDKTVIEKLGDPMLHLIRNSIDHGIEQPGIRSKAGKSSRGTICLKAEHSGANVLISIQDDGKGLDPEMIRKKAIEKGIISPDTSLSKKEAFDLILTPGFSTVERVTSVSGRGVGMDVVISRIESLGGSIEINSTTGKGTTIILKLPLTLAIIEGLLVTLGEDCYVIPLNSVVECVELTHNDKQKTHGRHVIRVREEIVPYIYLREVFYINDQNKPDIEQIVITETNERRVGFVVDKVIGKHQTVIKNMGRLLNHIDGISGATIMGDGTVALILDNHKLIQYAENKEHILSNDTRSAEC